MPDPNGEQGRRALLQAESDLSDLSRLLPEGSQALALCDRALAVLAYVPDQQAERGLREDEVLVRLTRAEAGEVAHMAERGGAGSDIEKRGIRKLRAALASTPPERVEHYAPGVAAMLGHPEADDPPPESEQRCGVPMCGRPKGHQGPCTPDPHGPKQRPVHGGESEQEEPRGDG